MHQTAAHLLLYGLLLQSNCTPTPQGGGDGNQPNPTRSGTRHPPQPQHPQPLQPPAPTADTSPNTPVIQAPWTPPYAATLGAQHGFQPMAPTSFSWQATHAVANGGYITSFGGYALAPGAMVQTDGYGNPYVHMPMPAHQLQQLTPPQQAHPTGDQNPPLQPPPLQQQQPPPVHATPRANLRTQQPPNAAWQTQQQPGTARYAPPYDPATDPWNSPHSSPPTTPRHSGPPPAAGGPGQHTDPAQPPPADSTSASNPSDTKTDAPQPAQHNTQDFTGTVQSKAMPAEKCTIPSMHEPNTKPLPSIRSTAHCSTTTTRTGGQTPQPPRGTTR